MDDVNRQLDDIERGIHAAISLQQSYRQQRDWQKARADRYADLLRQAQTMLVHNRCAEDDAMQCAGCALEAAIQEALR